jgi:hypothetical protein
MSTMSKVMYSVQALDKLPKDTGNDMVPIGSIFLPPKPYRGFDASFNYYLGPFARRLRGTIFLRDFHCQLAPS